MFVIRCATERLTIASNSASRNAFVLEIGSVWAAVLNETASKPDTRRRQARLALQEIERPADAQRGV